jgi:monofunctional biosynthetic peptidoglycan transglycosylase
MRLALRLLYRAAIIFALISVGMVLIYRFVPPPGTPLMLLRKLDSRYSGRVIKRWVPLRRISPNVMRAVIASEDGRFCSHFGFDFKQIQQAIEDYEEGGDLRGASTITQQTAKNLFLWPGSDFVRKGFEAWFTVLLEVFWPKNRILEVYLNVVEWGNGIYGIEAAARHYYGRSARTLSAVQASRLAAVLPNPRIYSPVSPSRVARARANLIRARMNAVVLNGRVACR